LHFGWSKQNPSSNHHSVIDTKEGKIRVKPGFQNSDPDHNPKMKMTRFDDLDSGSHFTRLFYTGVKWKTGETITTYYDSTSLLLCLAGTNPLGGAVLCLGSFIFVFITLPRGPQLKFTLKSNLIFFTFRPFFHLFIFFFFFLCFFFFTFFA
jgi:hypothetical protein